MLLSDAYGPSLLFGVNLFGPDAGAPEWRYWFVEALVYCLVPVVALLSVRRVGAAERARPFPFAVGALASASCCASRSPGPRSRSRCSPRW